MNCFDTIQIEEMENFDAIGKELEDLIEEQKEFNIKEYLNGNIDY